MAGWDKRLLCCAVFLFVGAAGQGVIYPPPVCGVKGSTVTLPCTFTPILEVEGVPIKIVRVRWCQNHQICQGTTPSVYDSNQTKENSYPQNNNPRYTYLGDKRSSCTLQIRGLQKQDEATLRFRMEASDSRGHFTEQSGVNVTVNDGVIMTIRSSRSDGEVTEGENITLSCSSVCSVDQLEVSWFRNNHSLSESGPGLRLTHLTAEHSGRYTCALKTNESTRSLPYILKVKNKEQTKNLPLIVGAVSSVLLVLLILPVVLCIFNRKRSAEKEQSAEGGEVNKKDQKTSQPVEDVSYASIQFTHQSRDRAVEQVEDSVIYSSVASRG